MNKFAVNYNKLEEDIADKPKVFRLADVRHKLTKVAFDVVKFHESEGLDGLWQIQKSDDGEYIVANYDDNALVAESAPANTPWKAVANDKTVHVFYKEDPVTKISLASLNIPLEEAGMFASNLTHSLAENKGLVSKMLKELDNTERKELFASHPELQD